MVGPQSPKSPILHSSPADLTSRPSLALLASAAKGFGRDELPYELG
jgi:hypothetical protein